MLKYCLLQVCFTICFRCGETQVQTTTIIMWMWITKLNCDQSMLYIFKITIGHPFDSSARREDNGLCGSNSLTLKNAGNTLLSIVRITDCYWMSYTKIVLIRMLYGAYTYI